MLIADRTLLNELSALQKKVLKHVTHFCLADVVLEQGEERFAKFNCYLTRIPKDELNCASEEEYLASAQKLAPDYMLALERDVPLKPETRTVFLDKWPEKQFCHPEEHSGECSRELNYCQLQCSGRNIDEMLAELLERLELLFDGWHLEMDDVCENRYSIKSYRAMWKEEVEARECLEELAAEKEGWDEDSGAKHN